MFSFRTIAGLTAVAALAGGTAGSAGASAATLAPGDAPLGSLIQKKPVRIAAHLASAPQPTSCRAWRVNGQTWFAGQGRYTTLMFTLRMASSISRHFSGYAQYYSGDYENLVGSQYISGGVGRTSTGVVSIIINIQWKNGTRGQYHATGYDPRSTPSGGLTASLKGTTVDTSGNGTSARWYADGLEGPLGDTNFARPLYCRPADVVR